MSTEIISTTPTSYQHQPWKSPECEPWQCPRCDRFNFGDDIDENCYYGCGYKLEDKLYKGIGWTCPECHNKNISFRFFKCKQCHHIPNNFDDIEFD